MKVYIVSSGSYSDYCIDKIFLDYEKAKVFHSLCSNHDLNDIEEFELSDNEIFTPYYYIDFKYYIPGMEQCYIKSSYPINKPHLMGGEYYINVGQCLDTDLYCKQRRTTYYNGIITLHRPIGPTKNNIDIDALANKYKKVCCDLTAQIRYWFFNGYNEFDVRNVFDKEYNNINEDCNP